MSLPHLDERTLLVRHAFDAQALVTTYPPRLTHAHKKLVYALACPPGAPHEGTLVLSRWGAMPLPDRVPAAVPIGEMREDVFGYEPTPAGPPVVEWYVNFADSNLFVAYGGPLFAQDEMQVAEHPALGSLREALKAHKDPRFAPATRDQTGPTPILVRGVERRCAVATDPDPLEGRPLGLYGNRFARADAAAIRRATTVLTPPTITNLIAMEAPPGGHGAYAAAELRDIVTTAFTAFGAAALESALAAPGAAVVVHTGHWGTGAYGGHRVLMALLQRVAARLAGVGTLVFHTFDAEGSEAYREALRVEAKVMPEGAAVGVDEVLGKILAMGFRWGESDGN
jgi:hypothetical protein